MANKPITSFESYRQILRATSILGGASAINIIVRVIRTKFMAVLLGTSGVGLWGIYNSITDMVIAIARMGIDNSGMRRTAEAVSAGDEATIARVLFTLRRVSLYLGVFGLISLLILSFPIYSLTFEDFRYASDVRLLAIVIFLEIIISGEVARIQGMRKIGDLARFSVFSAFYATLLTIPILYIWGQTGIVPSLILSSTVGLLVASWYSRKIKAHHVSMDWKSFLSEAKPLLLLGSVFMVGDLISKSTMWLLRVLVVRKLGIDAVGLYLASMTISSIYVGFILEAMIKDYYPRLTAIAKEDTAFNKLVNQQMEIGMLLSLPGIIATLTLAPVIIKVIYTAEFVAAFEILRWQILGSMLRVASWPMGFMPQAKGRGRLFLLTELLWNGVHIVLLLAGMHFFGLKGAGIAYLGANIFYLVLIYCVAHKMTGFTLSSENIRISIVILSSVGIVFALSLLLDDIWYMILGSSISIAAAVYSIKSLITIIGPERIASLLEGLKERFNSPKI